MVRIALISCPAFAEGRVVLRAISLFNGVPGIELMSAADRPVVYLRVSAEPDPGVLARIIERFQNLNIVPRRILAEWATTGILHVQVDIAGLSDERVSLIAAKLGQVPTILNAYWHR